MKHHDVILGAGPRSPGQAYRFAVAVFWIHDHGRPVPAENSTATGTPPAEPKLAMWRIGQVVTEFLFNLTCDGTRSEASAGHSMTKRHNGWLANNILPTSH